MKKSFKPAVLPALIASTLMLSACGSSEPTDATATADNSAAKSFSGIITGFGSVFVNGVEFETEQASFEVDDDSNSDQSDLRIGMRVTLRGSVNDDGMTGSAQSIVYENELKGPVSALTQTYDAVDPTLLVSVTLTIFGQQVEVTADTTFDDDYGLTMATLQVGDVLEVSGFSTASGIVATHIEKQKAGSFDETDPVELKGEISEVTANSFLLRGLQVQFDDTTEFDDGLTADALVNGLFVEAKGLFDSTANVLMASKIEATHDQFEDDEDEVEIEGVVSDYDADAQTFMLQGVTVDFSAAVTLSPANLQIADDLKLEVEGDMQNGVLVASKIKQRGQKIKVKAPVASINDIDTADPSISLSLFGGTGNITVRVSGQTEMKDDQGEQDHITLADLNVGDYVEIKAFYDGTAVINAVELERDEMDKIRLQGPLAGFDPVAMTVTLFDQDFDLSQASFSAGDMDVSLSDFYAALVDGQFIKLTDKNADGVIDEVELEHEDD